MADLHLYLAVGLPTLAVVSSLIVSMIQIGVIREDILGLRNDMKLLTGKVYEMMGQQH